MHTIPDALAHYLASLTDKQKEAAILYYVDGLTLREIAVKLGISHIAVRSRLLAVEKKFPHLRDHRRRMIGIARATIRRKVSPGY